MELYKSTPESSFQEVKNFNYKTNFITDLVNFGKEYRDFKIAYIDENKEGKNGILLCISCFRTKGCPP